MTSSVDPVASEAATWRTVVAGPAVAVVAVVIALVGTQAAGVPFADWADGRVLLASYHPSNQNTQTGKLTRPMFVRIFKEAARIADE